jgi:hypothetical protein
MARPLNTKRLLKQCQAISRQQKAAKEPKVVEPEPEPIEQKEGRPMTPAELEQYLTEFLQVARDAERRFNEAVAAEQYPNTAIQDILHAAEFAPSTIREMDIVGKLHTYRTQRRITKQELEVTEIWKAWADEHKTAINKLENVLGNMRKVLRRQPNDYYLYKTDAVSEPNKALVPDPIEEKGEPDESSEI